MILLFCCEVLFLVEFCLFFGLVVAVLEFGFHIFPHGEGEIVDGVLCELTVFLGLGSPLFFFSAHSLVLK